MPLRAADHLADQPTGGGCLQDRANGRPRGATRERLAGSKFVRVSYLTGCDRRDAAFAHTGQSVCDLGGRPDHGDVLGPLAPSRSSIARYDGSPPYMTNNSAARSRAFSGLSVNSTVAPLQSGVGDDLRPRPRGRSRARCGRPCSVDHRSDGSIGHLASEFEHLGPSAATNTCGAGAATSTEPCELTASPSTDDASPESIGISASKGTSCVAAASRRTGPTSTQPPPGGTDRYPGSRGPRSPG